MGGDFVFSLIQKKKKRKKTSPVRNIVLQVTLFATGPQKKVYNRSDPITVGERN